MRKIGFSAALAMSLLLLIVVFPGRTQVQTDEYTHQVSLAHGYMQERRYQDALDALRKAYDLRPNPQVLADMGKSFMALGMSTEAEDVFTQVLSQGGEISFDLLHRHGTGQCYGSLIVGSQQVSWAGQGKNEAFQILPAEIQDLNKWNYTPYTQPDLEVPMFRFRAAKKNWVYEYLLNGRVKYETATFGFGDMYVVYRNADFTNADKATDLIMRLISKAASSSVKTRAPDLPPQAKPEVGRSSESQGFQEQARGISSPSGTELKEGQTMQEVEKILGKPEDVITVKDTVIYIYATVKVFFENGKLANVEERKR